MAGWEDKTLFNRVFQQAKPFFGNLASSSKWDGTNPLSGNSPKKIP